MKPDELFKIIEERKKLKPEGSYVASLFNEGGDRIIQKVGEEAIETVIAAKNNNKKQMISETADLIFHTLVLLSFLDIGIEDVYEELGKRHKK